MRAPTQPHDQLVSGKTKRLQGWNVKPPLQPLRSREKAADSGLFTLEGDLMSFWGGEHPEVLGREGGGPREGTLGLHLLWALCPLPLLRLAIPEWHPLEQIGRRK